MTVPLVAPRHPLQSRSGREQLKPVRLGLTFQFEKLSTIAKEILPLFKQHWQEIALNQDTIPLDPDWERYFSYELVGILHVLTARRDGKLVGYIFNCVGPHLHYVTTQWGMTDMYWLHPSERRGWTAYRMFKRSIAHMRKLGVKVVYASEKIHFHNHNQRGVAFLFHRLGFKPIESTWSLTL